MEGKEISCGHDVHKKTRDNIGEEYGMVGRNAARYDYPTFHLSMDCFWAEVTAGHLELKEAEAAKWLTKDQLDSVAWLPADVTLIEKIRRNMEN